MNTRDSIRVVLEFYRELGFERLPMDFDTAVLKNLEKEVVPVAPLLAEANAPVLAPLPSHESPQKESAFKDLREEMGDCQRCGLSRGRTHIVFGEGNPDAEIMFIGEAPGKEEDLQARPFVGDAGQLLTKLIEKMGLRRSDVYIANIVKCRPPLNRDPQDDEMSACSAFLNRQIEIISPRVIVSLGKISTYTLLGIKGPISKFSITKTRGKFHEYKGIPLMPTFHPAYLLRNPRDKWLTWEDAQAVLKILKGE